MLAFGVPHPPQSLPDVGRPEARSAHICNPANISHCFQVSRYSGDPFTSIAACNLLAKHACRPALGDEPPKSGPKVAFVVNAFALSRDTEWLTRARSCPDWSVVGPISHPQCERPSANACEKVTLCKSVEVCRGDVSDVPLIDYPVRDQSVRYQFS